MLLKKTYLLRCFSFFSLMAVLPTLYAAPLLLKEPMMVDTLFAQTKPQCVGVYLVDVPESFVNDTHTATYDDFKIESLFIYPPAFKQRITLREEALKNQTTSEKNAPVLKEKILLPNNLGVIFDKNQSGSDDAYRTLEAHVYVDHIAFIITIDILDLSAPKYAEERQNYLNSGFAEFKLNDKYTKLTALRSLISRLKGRLDHEVPTEKGACIPNGFIADDNGRHEIKVGLSYENDDFLLALHMNNQVKEGNKKTFNRDEEIKKSLEHSFLKFVKKYQITPNGIPADVWFLKGNQSYDKKTMEVYKFNLYANEDIASLQHPWMTIGFNSQYKQTRYSEAQMVDIWERITRTLRYKPNAL